jgi:tetratricopeptide (TPR) repeat protein
VKVLSFILGIDGDRELGIRELKLVAEKGVYKKSEAMFFLGAIYVYRERDYDKAMRIWDELLEKYPDNPGVLIHVGATYSRMGRCDQSLEVYEKVLARLDEEMLTPVSSIHYQMGQVYFRMNMFDKSIESFMKSIETDTLFSGNRRWTYGWSQFWLGRSYDMVGDTTKAKKFYSNINEDDSERAYHRAQERLEESFSEIDKEIVIIRNKIDCLDLDNALIRLDDLSKKHDDLGNYRIFEINYYKGQVMYLQNRYNHAIQQFNTLVDDESTEDYWFWYWSYYYRGKSYLKLGMVEKAMEDFEVAEESDSNNLTDRIKKEYMLLGL